MRTDTVMMDQEEHLTEKGQLKFFTRSAARHLRRKRLHDARRAEKEQDSNQEFIAEKDIDQPEVITKSKARRLRKKNKTKLLPTCCSYCESYCKSSPVIETITNQEVLTERDIEDIQTITKSKARRLRKKNKTKLVQNTCSFCYNTYSSPIDPILLKYIKTSEYDSVCCTKRETDRVSNLKHNYKPERAVEAQVYNVQYDKQKEQTELKSGNIESQENCLDVTCLSRSSESLQFGNEVQTCQEQHNTSPYNPELASQLKQTIVETIITRINCTKEDTNLQRCEAKQFSNLSNSCDSPEIQESVDLANLDQSIEFCDIGCNKVNIFRLESPSSESKKDNVVLEKETELKTSSEADTPHLTVTTFFSIEELVENVKNLRYNNTSENNLDTFSQENTKISSDNTELQTDDTIRIVRENIKSVDSTEQLSKTGLVSNSNSNFIVTQNFSCDLNSSQKEVEATEVEKQYSMQNIERLTNTTSLSENVEHNKPVDVSSLNSSISAKTADNKMNAPEKTREEIKAEREAKKAAKALAKAKAKTAKIQDKDASNSKHSLRDSTMNKQNSETLKIISNENVQTQQILPIINKSLSTSAKNTPLEVHSEEKSKAELRAERRAKQEAQRAAKQQLLQEKSKAKFKENNNDMCAVVDETNFTKKITTPKKTLQKDNNHEINLFKHLYHEREQAIVDGLPVNSNIHPAIVRLGVQYANKVIVGSNARCVALLAAIKQLIQDFERPSQVDFSRGLEATLNKSVAYLHYCRPLAVSMQNALRHLKWQMTQLPSVSSDADAKTKLGNAIDTYILEQIQLADKAISITIQTKISNGDIILTYSYSSLIHKILLDAHTAGKQFRVIIVDGRPWLEGKEQLRRLAKHGIECSYILINALSYVMPEVSKVFLGAHAILANGAVMSRVGTAQVALMARAFNIPVLVACETHKSCERVQTDSIVYNELGNADELVQGYGAGTKKSLLVNWKSKKSLNLLNIMYDVTPADLVTAVVTELAILPCTSVPVILRIKPSEI